MAGPFRLTSRQVNEHTFKRSPGIYVLRDRPSGPVRYVGRSDTNVRRRLMTHAGSGQHGYFTVKHKKDPLDAWIDEAHLFHYHRSTIRNEAHPNPPRGYSCPKCNLFGA